jgi:hypothetical protein
LHIVFGDIYAIVNTKTGALPTFHIVNNLRGETYSRAAHLGQNLQDHPHIHCIMPGGALNVKKKAWAPGANGFLFPVAVIRRLFKGIFMDYFTKAVANGTVSVVRENHTDVTTYDCLVNTF